MVISYLRGEQILTNGLQTPLPWLLGAIGGGRFAQAADPYREATDGNGIDR